MERRPCQYEQDKFPIFPPEHIFHGKKRYGKGEIIPDRVQAVKIIAAGHQQEHGKSEITPLILQRLHKKERRQQ